MKIQSYWKKKIITKQLRLLQDVRKEDNLIKYGAVLKVLQITDKTDKYLGLLK